MAPAELHRLIGRDDPLQQHQASAVILMGRECDPGLTTGSLSPSPRLTGEEGAEASTADSEEDRLELAHHHHEVGHFTEGCVEIGPVVGEKAVEIGIQDDPGIDVIGDRQLMQDGVHDIKAIEG